ncbi:hypothetical protein [Pendulispora albinea]|uniref:Lipoprotein n=1 Tax=Pendulispora albinea TaxID=2741071 RepID=A0ABZ2M1G9_9BACT
MRTRFFVLALCAFGALGALFAPGCSDQAEGERCDSRNGDSDCAAGLQCIRVNAGETDRFNFRCCPTDRPSTVSECIRSANPSDPSPPDGSADTGADAADTGTDAQTDAPVDSGSDADAADSAG